MIALSEANPETVEPGLLASFRLLVALPILAGVTVLALSTFTDFAAVKLLIASFQLQQLAIPKLLTRPLIFFGACQVVSLAYLAWPRLPVRLGKAFLPIALTLCTIGSLGAFALTMADTSSSHLNVLDEVFRSSYFGLIVVVLIGWQYDFRRVIFYCAGLALFELGVMTVLLRIGESYAWNIIGFTTPRTVIFFAVGYLVTQLIKQQRQQRVALAQANAQLRQAALTQEQLAISRERNHLARELHDTLAHHMSGMVLQLEGVKLLWDNDEAKAKATLEASIATTRQGLTETRRALQALRASPLEDLGLVQAMHNLAVSTAERAGLQLELQLPAELLSLKPSVEQVLYRIVQEALTNSERHANAQRLCIHLQQKQRLLTLRIQDDGAGFQVTDVDRQERFGLRGMEERAAMVGGVLHVQSEPGCGTTIEFSLALD